MSPAGGVGRVASDGTATVPSGISPGAGAGMPLGLTGATAATRYAGGTTSGAPVTGTFQTGDFVIAQDGAVWICTAAGSPGTWAEVGDGSFSGPITSSSDITARLSAAGQVLIGNAGPSSQAGMALGSTGAEKLYRQGSSEIRANAHLETILDMRAREGSSSLTRIGEAGPSAEGGVAAGALLDVAWYRSAANVWRTPDAVVVEGTLGSLSDITAGLGGAGSVVANGAGADTAQLGYLQNGPSTGYKPGLEFRSGGPVNIYADAATSLGVTLNSEATFRYKLTTTGIQWVNAANQQTTVGAAGAASALPATPEVYLAVRNAAGTVLVIPAYLAS